MVSIPGVLRIGSEYQVRPDIVLCGHEASNDEVVKAAADFMAHESGFTTAEVLKECGQCAEELICAACALAIAEKLPAAA